MAHIPDEAINRAVVHVVERNRELDDSKAGPEVATRLEASKACEQGASASERASTRETALPMNRRVGRRTCMPQQQPSSWS